MRAIVLEQFGGIERLTLKDIEIPKIKEGEVLVETKAFGVNPVDYKTRAGGAAAKRLKLPIILGWDLCGKVAETHKDSKFKVGDIVFGMINFPGEGKTYAEYVVAPEEHITLKPENISVAEAAAIPLAALTAYQALIKKGKIQNGSKVLILGASGGVGHLAVQIAKSVGAYVIGVASGKNEEFLTSIGVDQFIDYTKEDFAKLVKDIDFALDCIGGETVLKAISVIKDGGKLITLPSPINKESNTVNPKVEVPWVLVQSDQKDMNAISDLVKKGKLKVHIDKIFSLDKVCNAHYYLEHEKIVGKIVVTI
jgi:2-desacetyl-2-hydroxyethyl bacteriochlorophyllide A dehydrogenase